MSIIPYLLVGFQTSVRLLNVLLYNASKAVLIF